MEIYNFPALNAFFRKNIQKQICREKIGMKKHMLYFLWEFLACILHC